MDREEREKIAMKRLAKFGLLPCLLLLAAGLSSSATAASGRNKYPPQGRKPASKQPSGPGNQSKPPAPSNQKNGQKGNQNPGPKPNTGQGPNPGGNPPGNGRAGAGMPPKFIDQLRGMDPDQQERFMMNNQRFQNMPPQQQAQIRKSLQNWNSLSPEQRSVIRARETAIEQMTPQEQQYVHQQLQPAWRDMPAPQKKFMQQHLHELYGMSTPEAQAKLNDPAFTRGMTPEEQKMLPYLYRMRVGAAPEPPPGPPEY